MKQRLLIAVLTVGVFVAGYVASMWVASDRPLPAPPAPILAELGTGKQAVPGSEAKSPPRPSPINREQLAAEIARLGPQIEAFRKRMDEIEAEYERDLLPILTPAQCKKYTDWQKKRNQRDPKESAKPAPSQPLTDEEIVRLQERPLYTMLNRVVISLRIDWMVHEYQLSDAQLEQVRAALVARREKFLALLDSAPPPSLKLSRLAPEVQRLAGPKK